MRARYEKSFERGQELVRYFMFAAIVSALAGLLLAESNSTLQYVLIGLSAVLLIAMLVCAWRFCRCPYCGKRILSGALVVTSCPSCRRDLKSGRKVKKSKR